MKCTANGKRLSEQRTKFKSDRSMNTSHNLTAVALRGNGAFCPFSYASYFFYVPYQHSIAVVMVVIAVVIITP